MAKFFIDRPIVAIVISIVMTIVGAIAYLQLPVAQFPDIVPPEIQVQDDLHRRRRAHGRAIGRDAHRAADERRRSDELHAVGERQRRHDQADGELRGRHRSEHRPDPVADAREPGVSRSCRRT